ncbi:MAG TPA: NAD-dependent epimerase/dehydratase family protein, partial [Ignavibacteria bacterium]|nr:NAD-dependent epimerase/dehydratase family protein [Ignavibacteria bacterium]
MQKIVITGANGFVASHFILGLLQQNYEVIAFVRNGKKQSASQRMLDVLNKIDSDNKADYSHLKVFNYSLFDENYSLTK